jgi:predicted metal-binding membrane protein
MSTRRGIFPVTLILLAMISLAWGFVLWTTANMNAPVVRLMMPATSAWSWLEVIWVWVMWAVMMGAMMLLPKGDTLGKIGGILMVGWGLVLMAS